MTELELSAIARICLLKRIASIGELTNEVETLVKEREKLKIKINWQFPLAQASGKLSRHYEKVITKN